MMILLVIILLLLLLLQIIMMITNNDRPFFCFSTKSALGASARAAGGETLDLLYRKCAKHVR